MSVEPQPYVVKCPKCGYTKLIKNYSDLLEPTQNICKRCNLSMLLTDNILDKLTATVKYSFHNN